MLRLGHIDFSNCFPVHALLLERGAPAGIVLSSGTPAELNAELAAGRVDVAPASSIEYARHAERYRLFPDLAIGSRGPVGSIVLESARRVDELDEQVVALPTASATSVVLLRLLLERRADLRPRYVWYDQTRTPDPLAEGASAALWIGDVALRRPERNERFFVDLGQAWREWTGLPFAYAVWQTSAGPERDAELCALQRALLASRAYFETSAAALAERHAAHFGLDPARLLEYWRSLDYTLGEDMLRGLVHFYRLAAELGEAPGVPALRWIPTS
ncbi:MAG: menaquinone biosynthesis protein [Gemmatimonadetes bacterium]|nr:menaquinone biosynthesis protein [Gemmatimonadota bacterium]